MSDTVDLRARANPWTLLIDETRHALAHLRAEDLEELAERAQCMLHATVAEDLVRQRISPPEQHEMKDLGNQHHLLGDLLRATGENLKVLERTVGDVNSPWVR